MAEAALALPGINFKAMYTYFSVPMEHDRAWQPLATVGHSPRPGSLPQTANVCLPELPSCPHLLSPLLPSPCAGGKCKHESSREGERMLEGMGSLAQLWAA